MWESPDRVKQREDRHAVDREPCVRAEAIVTAPQEPSTRRLAMPGAIDQLASIRTAEWRATTANVAV